MQHGILLDSESRHGHAELIGVFAQRRQETSIEFFISGKHQSGMHRREVKMERKGRRSRAENYKSTYAKTVMSGVWLNSWHMM